MNTGPQARDAAEARHLATDHLLGDLRGRTVSNGFVAAVAQSTEFAVTMGAAMVLARLLLPGDFGRVAIVTAIIGILRIIPDAGLSTATIQRERITHAQVSNLFWANLAFSALASLIVAACAPVVAWVYGDPSLLGITLTLAITFVLNGLGVQHLALLNRQLRMKAIAIIRVGSVVSGVSLGIAMACLDCGYWSLVGAQLATPLSALLLTWQASRWRPQRPARSGETRSMLGFGANVTASTFIYSLARATDGLLIGKWYGSDAVGLYSRASLLTRPVDQLALPVSAVLVPVLSRLQEQPDRYRRMFLQVHDAISVVGFLFNALLLPLAHPLTLVMLGPRWESAANIVAGFTLASLFLPLFCTSSMLFASQGRGADWLRASSGISVLTLASFVIGLPFGPAGVALLYSLTGVLIELPFLYYVAGRQGPVSARDLWLGFVRHVPLWGVVFGATWLMRSVLVELGSLAQLAVCIPFGLLAGAVFAALFAPARRTLLNVLEMLSVLRGAAVRSAGRS